MSKGYISDTELVDQYDAARDKALCIDRIAVHCHTTRKAVRERLVKLGCIEEPAPDKVKPYTPESKKKRSAAPAAPLDELRAMELWNEGLDDIAMADSLGVTVARVRAWRSRMHLQRPRGTAAHKKKPKEETAMEQMTGKLENADDSSVCELPPAASKAAEQISEPTAAPVEELPVTPVEPCEDASPITIAGFKAMLTQFLSPALDEAELYIDGVPVRGIFGFSVTMPDGYPIVDLRTTEGGA